MIELSSPPDRYRPCVGILLLNDADEIFVGERLDAPEAWQMPQGGIDPGESAVEAAFRELREETGIEKAEILGIDNTWRTYTLPRRVSRKAWGGKYIGQAQIWVAFRLPAKIRISILRPKNLNSQGGNGPMWKILSGKSSISNGTSIGMC